MRALALTCALAACSDTGEPGEVASDFAVEMLTDALDLPVGLAALPDGRVLITEQDSGEIRLFAAGALAPEPVATVATAGAFGCGESGLLGIAAHPEFASNGWFYVYYTNAADTAHVVSRFTLDGDVAAGETVILTLDPTSAGSGNSCANHNGGALAFDADGLLYVTNGERGSFRDAAQDGGSLLGKTLRLTDTGAPAPGNPFGDAVFSLGHRNSYGLAFQARSGELYETENGPDADDEINRVVAGDNYGWPIDTGDNAGAAFHDPVRVYDPPICLTGMASYGGGPFPDEMDGDLFYGDCRTGHLHRMRISQADPDVAVEVDDDFAAVPGATIDVEWSEADGAIYFTAMRYLEDAPGRLYRVTYAPSP
jgi:glucose/arabinose dehydrogenase